PLPEKLHSPVTPCSDFRIRCGLTPTPLPRDPPASGNSAPEMLFGYPVEQRHSLGLSGSLSTWCEVGNVEALDRLCPRHRALSGNGKVAAIDRHVTVPAQLNPLKPQLQMASSWEEDVSNDGNQGWLSVTRPAAALFVSSLGQEIFVKQMNRKEPFPVNLEEPAKYLGMKAAEALQQLRPVRRAGRHPYFWLFAPTQNCLLWLPEMTESAAPKKGCQRHHNTHSLGKPEAVCDSSQINGQHDPNPYGTVAFESSVGKMDYSVNGFGTADCQLEPPLSPYTGVNSRWQGSLKTQGWCNLCPRGSPGALCRQAAEVWDRCGQATPCGNRSRANEYMTPRKQGVKSAGAGELEGVQGIGVRRAWVGVQVVEGWRVWRVGEYWSMWKVLGCGELEGVQGIGRHENLEPGDCPLAPDLHLVYCSAAVHKSLVTTVALEAWHYYFL
ncbi:hypothetical protein U0070_025262, partial [Myodes glareolus]